MRPLPFTSMVPRSSERGGGGFRLALAAIAILSFAVHADSFRLAHVEGDEVVFTFLAERLAETPGAYHLQGALEGPAARRFVRDAWAPQWTPPPGHPEHARWAAAWAALDRAEVLFHPLSRERAYAYDPTVYDHPFFFHPPVYPYALAAARAVAGRLGGVALSAGAHAATTVLVGGIGATLGGPALGLVAALLVALDPVLWLAGSRLWIDGPSATAATAAVAVALAAGRAGGIARALAVGAVLGIAALTKLSSLLVAPAVLAALLVGPRRPRPLELLVAAAVPAAMVLAWMAVTDAYYGAWLPTVRMTPWILERSPYLRMVSRRPLHFYATALVLVAPVYALAVGCLGRPAWRRLALVPAVWAGSIVGGFVLLAVLGLGGGFQLRYLAPAMPAFALLAAVPIAHGGRAVRTVAAALVLAGALSGWASARFPSSAEPYPVAADVVLGRIGLSVSKVAPGLWSPS